MHRPDVVWFLPMLPKVPPDWCVCLLVLVLTVCWLGSLLGYLAKCYGEITHYTDSLFNCSSTQVALQKYRNVSNKAPFGTCFTCRTATSTKPTA